MALRHARICCLDLDTFFVSVERLFRPELRGKPVVIGAMPGQRGVVSACSYEVRAFGVRSGMPIADASRLAPDAIFLPLRHAAYRPYSAKVRAILERFTPDVRPASIDEFYLDFHGTERLHTHRDDPDSDATIARTITEMRHTIQRELGLPSSAGIGATRAVAKIASGQAKPMGTRLVRPGEEHAFLSPLPTRAFPGIGPVTERKLTSAGIRTLGQLLNAPDVPPYSRFRRVIAMVRRGADGDPDIGKAHRPAFREHDPRGLQAGSISNERTFHADLDDDVTVERQLQALVERVCWRARKRQVRARTLTLKLRYADFETLTRARTVHPTHAESAVLACVLDLLRRHRSPEKPVRLLGVALSNLVGPQQQLGLFDADVRPPSGRAVDAVRAKFGYDAIRVGATGPGGRWSA